MYKLATTSDNNIITTRCKHSIYVVSSCVGTRCLGTHIIKK